MWWNFFFWCSEFLTTCSPNFITVYLMAYAWHLWIDILVHDISEAIESNFIVRLEQISSDIWISDLFVPLRHLTFPCHSHPPFFPSPTSEWGRARERVAKLWFPFDPEASWRGLSVWKEHGEGGMFSELCRETLRKAAVSCSSGRSASSSPSPPSSPPSSPSRVLGGGILKIPDTRNFRSNAYYPAQQERPRREFRE